MEVKTIKEYLTKYDNIEVIIDNNIYEINDLDKLNDVIKEILNCSREMPAFGVSLDNETKTAIQNGVWLKFKYDKVENFNDMSFDTLLINIVPEYSGFNIIRGNHNVYEGRCFYISLNGTMKPLYDYLIKTSIK
jgi:hypothetical protein